MAARVNTRFMVILGAALVAVFAGVAYLGYSAIKKSGDDYVKLGDEAMAQNKVPEAIDFYARAVNKDQKNAEWVRKWLAAMEKHVPEGRTAYQDTYQKQFVLALRALPDADPTDPAAHRRYLDEIYGQVKSDQRFGAMRAHPEFLAELEGMAQIADDLIKGYRGDEQAGRVLKRYRGLPKVAMLAINLDMKPDELEAARKDLEDAVAADPADAESVMGLAKIDLALADRAGKRNDQPERQRLMDAAESRLTRFTAEHPPAPSVRLMLLNLASLRGTMDTGKPVTMAEVLQDRQPQLREVIDAIKAERPERVELDTARTATLYAQIALPQEEARAGADAIMAHLLSGRPDDAKLLRAKAELELMRGNTEGAMASLRRIVELPDKPLSIEGLRLFWQRVESIALQTDVTFGRWEGEKDPAKKAELAGTARKLRDELAASIGETNERVMSIDARLSLINGDLNGARTLLTKYNQQTGEKDAASMALMGDILMRQGNTGAAKSTFERVVQLDERNVRSIRALMQIEAGAGRYPEALRYAGQLAAITPDDKAVQEQRAVYEKIVNRGGEADPVLDLVVKVQQMVTGVGADVPGAIRLVEDFLAKPNQKKDLRPWVTLVRLHLGSNDRAKAEAVLDRAMAEFPADENLKALKANLGQADPVGYAVEQIDKAPNLSPLEKLLRKHDVLSRNGKPDQAKPLLAEMARTAPEDPAVVELLFQDAMTRKDAARIAELAALAEAKDLDKLGGLLFRARAQITENKMTEAAQSLRAAIERDKLNQLAWRLLGAIEMGRGNIPQAVEAYGKAVEIKPTDVPSATGYVDALRRSGDLPEALKQARRLEPGVGADPGFAELLLAVESAAPGGDRDKAVRLRQQIAATRPENQMNRAELALMLMQQKKFAESRTVIDGLKAGDGSGTGAADSEETRDAVTQLEAQWFALQGRYAEAEKAYDDWVAARPADKLNESVYLAASNLFTTVGQPARSLAFLEKGRGLEKPATMLISKQIGDVLFTSGRQADAAEAYRRVLQAGAADEGDMVSKRLLNCYLDTGDWAKFDELMTSLGDKAAQDSTLLLLAAEAAVRQDDAAGAAKLFDQAVVRAPKEALVFLKRAEFSARDPAKLRDAEADLEQAVRLAPAQPLPRVRLASLYMGTGRAEQAAQSLRKALELEPGDDGLRAQVIRLLLGLGQEDAAVGLVDEAIKGDTEGVKWLLQGAALMVELGRTNTATDYLARAWERNKGLEVAIPYVTALVSKTPPDLVAAGRIASDKSLDTADEMAVRVLKAMVAQRSGQAGRADEEFARAYAKVDHDNAQRVELFIAGLDSVHPADQKAQLATLAKLEARAKFTGWMYVQANVVRMRDPALAERVAADTEAFADASPDNSLKLSVYRVLGLYQVQKARPAEAVALYRKFLAISPDDPEVLNNAAYLLATDLKQPADALAMARKAAELAPNSSSVLDTLGVVQLGLKDTDAAIGSLTAAIEKARSNNDRVPALIHRARAHMAKGSKAEARRDSTQAHELIDADAVLKRQYEKELQDLDIEIGTG